MSSFIRQCPTAQATHEYFSVAHSIQAKSTDPQARCCYPSKRCENARAVKRNGELHRFCEVHRAKAATNQRRLAHRRKVEEMVERLPIDEYMQQLNEQYDLFAEQGQHDEELPPSDLLMRLALDEDDLRVLAEVLSVNDGEDMMADA